MRDSLEAQRLASLLISCSVTSGMESLPQERLGEEIHLVPDGAEGPENGQSQSGELIRLMMLFHSLPVT
jgi:hypothetical protein